MKSYRFEVCRSLGRAVAFIVAEQNATRTALWHFHAAPTSRKIAVASDAAKSPGRSLDEPHRARQNDATLILLRARSSVG